MKVIRFLGSTKSNLLAEKWDTEVLTCLRHQQEPPAILVKAKDQQAWVLSKDTSLKHLKKKSGDFSNGTHTNAC